MTLFGMESESELNVRISDCMPLKKVKKVNFEIYIADLYSGPIVQSDMV